MRKFMIFVLMISVIGSFADSRGAVEQISISKIKQMPNMPQPYLMRNWRQVAVDYDSLAFDFNAAGQYLPLVRMAPGFNKDKSDTFALPTFVGDTRQSQEAITALGAINAAGVARIDKSNQERNWIDYVKYYFNDAENIGLYLNSHTDRTGGTFWYELLPNILFYRIYSYYPNTDQLLEQFETIADRIYDACIAMGANADPWVVPDFNYTAFNFQTMQPVRNNIWTEAGSAGAIAWLQYMAYVETNDKQYLDGARWGLDFLEQLEVNPFYEALLPHGVYTAARMNAQQGTSYDVEKLFNWCFDGSNSRRWGVTTGKWGNMDCAGLVGSVYEDREFAFAMNTFNLANSLVPVARYDQRFARAVGKWMLNAANSSRFFYAQYLPEDHQTDWAWASKNDSNSCLAYEGLRSQAIYIDRIQADINTKYGQVVSGDYRDTIFTNRKYQVFEEQSQDDENRLEHIWKVNSTPAEKSILNVVGKADNDVSLDILYSDSPCGPFKPVTTLNFVQGVISASTTRIDLTSETTYLKISSRNRNAEPAKIYIDDHSCPRQAI